MTPNTPCLMHLVNKNFVVATPFNRQYPTHIRKNVAYIFRIKMTYGAYPGRRSYGDGSPKAFDPVHKLIPNASQLRQVFEGFLAIAHNNFSSLRHR